MEVFARGDKLETHEVQGRTRRDRVLAIAKSIGMTLTADGRWRLIRDGFPKFQTLATASYRTFWGKTPEAGEIRRAFDIIEKWSRQNDGHLWPAFERMYDVRVALERAESQAESRTHEAVEDDTIHVEHVNEGSLQHVDPRETLRRAGR